jgi:hypothetical protein
LGSTPLDDFLQLIHMLLQLRGCCRMATVCLRTAASSSERCVVGVRESAAVLWSVVCGGGLLLRALGSGAGVAEEGPGSIFAGVTAGGSGSGGGSSSDGASGSAPAARPVCPARAGCRAARSARTYPEPRRPAAPGLRPSCSCLYGWLSVRLRRRHLRRCNISNCRKTPRTACREQHVVKHLRRGGDRARAGERVRRRRSRSSLARHPPLAPRTGVLAAQRGDARA